MNLKVFCMFFPSCVLMCFGYGGGDERDEFIEDRTGDHGVRGVLF